MRKTPQTQEAAPQQPADAVLYPRLTEFQVGHHKQDRECAVLMMKSAMGKAYFFHMTISDLRQFSEFCLAEAKRLAGGAVIQDVKPIKPVPPGGLYIAE